MTSDEAGLRIGTLFGFPVLVHRSMLGAAPTVALLLLLAGSTSGLLNGLILLAVIVLSVLAHEVAHAVAARALGVPVQHIALTWYGGYARFWTQPTTRLQEICIAVAGPVANLVISAAAFSMQALLPAQSNISGMGADLIITFRDVTPLEYALRATAWTNLGLGIFNLLPGLPLDGGHILRSLLSLSMPRGRAGSIAAWCGLWTGITTVAAGFAFENLWTLVIGASLVLSAWGLLRNRAYG